MLAPRKTLWSTPDAVIDRVVELLPISAKDRVCDIGCGDGRCLIRWATDYTTAIRLKEQEQRQEETNNSDKHHGSQEDEPSAGPCFVGIDIDAERIQQATALLEEAYCEGHIDPSISVSFHCKNALEATHLFQNATVFFLYLIPRGLRIIKPLILSSSKSNNQNKNDAATESTSSKTPIKKARDDATPPAASTIRVATYMSPLPDEKPILQERIRVGHHGDAVAWPIYMYEF